MPTKESTRKFVKEHGLEIVLGVALISVSAFAYTVVKKNNLYYDSMRNCENRPKLYLDDLNKYPNLAPVGNLLEELGYVARRH